MIMQAHVFVSSRNASSAQMIAFKNVNYKKESKNPEGSGTIPFALKINGQALLEIDFPELLDGA